MGNFVVSARKYRPQTFDSVVGQSAITTTLKNAIKNDHLAQAFLFFGSRGVGKTTTARILAKTLNCFNLGDNIEPCNACESCNSFNEGHSFNILELDAASNNSVDDIRNLIDQVRIAPQVGDYKIFIIDEVHMLSSSAFNAFLKTLEEPPAHAVFILATTEKHKILPTILSRCQIFDFHRIQINDIVNHLKNIAGKENVTVDDKGLHIIAQKADGALRDALSIFDQIVSFSNNNVTYEAVLKNLNVLDYDYFFKITDYALEGKIPDNLLVYNEILSHGFDGSQFLLGLAEHLRNLLVCKDPRTVDIMDVPEDLKATYTTQAEKAPEPFLLTGLDLLRATEDRYKASKNKRLHVEVALMKFSSIMSTLKKREVVS
jgi:DNA polymerase-3 subunit gamma/tau